MGEAPLIGTRGTRRIGRFGHFVGGFPRDQVCKPLRFMGRRMRGCQAAREHAPDVEREAQAVRLSREACI
jgi:hypothetical protein